MFLKGLVLKQQGINCIIGKLLPRLYVFIKGFTRRKTIDKKLLRLKGDYADNSLPAEYEEFITSYKQPGKRPVEQIAAGESGLFKGSPSSAANNEGETKKQKIE